MAAREDRSRSPRRATSYADLEGFLPDGMDSANPIFQQVKATLEALPTLLGPESSNPVQAYWPRQHILAPITVHSVGSSRPLCGPRTSRQNYVLTGFLAPLTICDGPTRPLWPPSLYTVLALPGRLAPIVYGDGPAVVFA